MRIETAALCALLSVRLGVALLHDRLQTQTYPQYTTYARLAAEGVVEERMRLFEAAGARRIRGAGAE